MVLTKEMALAEELANEWRSRLEAELPGHSAATRESIVRWLIGEDVSRFEGITPSLRQITEQAMDYRYRILRQRYLDVAPERAYKRLIQRLGSLFLIRNKIRTWIALSRDRQRSVVDVLEEVIQELLQNDTYMQQQILWISKCTRDQRLRNALLLASTEEYCLRPIRSQPLLAYRFVNYLRRSQRGGMTQVPAKDHIRLVSEEVAPDDADGSISLLDIQAVIQYQDAKAAEEQQELREAVRRQFEAYLIEKVGPEAADWLRLYLQGQTQEAIAQALDMPVKQVYRLREKINYHAVRVFASKNQQELVTSWLGNRSK
ncbi:HetZ-related protein 2 [Leptothermofonsia sp. ETS-13]|uniref:HetZ-related protein 2 n=1 Tax=Leptothermofonsia sp. ETS-13 TaxID=3035696 RepID=UPI003B9E7967